MALAAGLTVRPAPSNLDAAAERAHKAGARGPLEHIGSGITAEVFVDQKNLAYKVPRSIPAALTIAEEAEWLRVASQVPFVRDHVARFVRFDPATGVLVRENVQGLQQSRMPRKRPAERMTLWKLHEEIGRLVRPYGLGRPEFKEESYRLVRGRGWVLFDAGFSILFGRKLLERVPHVSPEGFEGSELAFAISHEMDEGDIPAHLARRALVTLARRSASARDYVLENHPELLDPLLGIARAAQTTLFGPALESPRAPAGGTWKEPTSVPLGLLDRFSPRTMSHLRRRLSGQERLDMVREILRPGRPWPSQLDPMEIAVSRKGGARLMDGNHRLIVAREVGLSTVPVAFLIVPYRDDRFILP
jgi:hypothetical protein